MAIDFSSLKIHVDSGRRKSERNLPISLSLATYERDQIIERWVRKDIMFTTQTEIQAAVNKSHSHYMAFMEVFGRGNFNDCRCTVCDWVRINITSEPLPNDFFND